MKRIDIASELKSNSYPGRGIIIGRSEDGKRAVLIYFIMGRSGRQPETGFFPSRRMASKPWRSTRRTLPDPSLYVYHPVRFCDGYIIVTNGDQTDTIRDHLSADNSFHTALLKREFEPGRARIIRRAYRGLFCRTAAIRCRS